MQVSIRALQRLHICQPNVQYQIADQAHSLKNFLDFVFSDDMTDDLAQMRISPTRVLRIAPHISIDLSEMEQASEQDNIDFQKFETEPVLQALLSDRCTGAPWHAIDTHDSEVRFPAFQPTSDPTEIFKQSGKPDLTSQKLPMFLEIKKHYAGKINNWKQHVSECIARACDMMVASAHLQQTIVHVVTDYRAMIITVSRTDDYTHFAVVATKVPVELVAPVWLELTRRAERNEISCFTGPGEHLVSYLQNLLPEHWKMSCLFVTRLLGKSMHPVFIVYPPIWDNGVVVRMDSNLCVKIICDGPKFQHETQVVALMNMQVPEHRNNSFIYSSVAISNIENSMAQSASITYRREAQLEQGWWIQKRDHAAHALPMMVAQPLESNDLSSFVSITQFLMVLWRAGYVHTDLRKHNLMVYKGVAQPIDFGEAVAIGSEVDLAQMSEHRLKLAKSAFSLGSLADSVHEPPSMPWQTETDLCMLEAAFLIAMTEPSPLP